MSFFSKIGGFFGLSPKGSQMSAADSATEDQIQKALDSAYGTAGTFGQRKISAADAENAMRKAGTLPQGWRLRESDSTSSGYRPTQAASKKMGALHAGEIAAAGVGGAAMLGAGPLAGLSTTATMGTNAAIQGGLGAAQGAEQGGLKGALIGGGLGAASGLVPGGGNLATKMATQGGLGAVRGLATGGGLQGALLGGGLGAGGAAAGQFAQGVTSNPLGQRATNWGLQTGLQAAGSGGRLNPYGLALGGANTFLPSAGLNPSLTRAISYGASQGGSLAQGRFNPVAATTGAFSTFGPASARTPQSQNIYRALNPLGGNLQWP